MPHKELVDQADEPTGPQDKNAASFKTKQSRMYIYRTATPTCTVCSIASIASIACACVGSIIVRTCCIGMAIMTIRCTLINVYNQINAEEMLIKYDRINQRDQHHANVECGGLVISAKLCR